MTRTRAWRWASNLFRTAPRTFRRRLRCERFEDRINPGFVGVSLQNEFDTFGSGSIPPDTSGAIGPTHIVESVNGALAFYTRAGVLVGGFQNPNTFFGSANGVFDPRVIYDRLSARFFMTEMDFGTGSVNNGIWLAVSRTSDPTGTWDKYLLPVGVASAFTDYSTLGVDANGVYIGMTISPSAGGSFAKVVATPKAPLIAASPSLGALTSVSNIGDMYSSPQPVFDVDNSSTTAFFVASSNTSNSDVRYRAVTWSGGVPTIAAVSTNVATPAYANIPQNFSPSGSTTALEAGDDRLMMALIRNGHLWTTRGVAVDASGGSSTTNDRDAVEWLDFTVSGTTLSLNQRGLVFDNAASTPRNYIYPSLTVTGQNNMRLGFSGAKTTEFVGAYSSGRLSTDGAGTTTAPALIQAGAASYTVTFGGSRNRWGDYSYTSTDPLDDQTAWTIQEYVAATNIWGTFVQSLAAPAPTLNNPNGTGVAGQNNVTLNLTGTNLFDPGAGFTNRLLVAFSGTGIAVNSVTYNNPTSATVVLNISAAAATGLRNITLTNPDGQFVTVTNAFTVTAADTSIDLDASNNLVVTDVSTTSNDGLTIKADTANSRYVITDPVNNLSTTVVGATAPNSHTIQIPYSAVAGTQIIFNTGLGNDTVTVDFSPGAFPQRVLFNGGTGVDSLKIANGTFTNAVFAYSNASDGGINLDGSAVSYTGLSPIDMVGFAVANLAMTLPAGFDNATLGDDGTAGNGISRFQGSPQTFETTTFPNPTASLTVNANGDQLNLAALDSGFATPAVTINGVTGLTNVGFAAANTLPAATAVTLAGGVNLTLNSFNETIGSLSGGSSATVTLTNGNTLTAGGNNGSTQFDGILTGPGGFKKSGSGTMRLTAASPNYTGPTTEIAGTLLVDGSILSSATTANGGVLGGTGTVGPVVAAGGTVNPGDPATGQGILTGSTADFSNGGTLTLQVGGLGVAGTDFDRVNLSGAATFGGSSVLNLDVAGLATSGGPVTLMTFSSRTGTFTTVNLLNNPLGLRALLTYSATSLTATFSGSATHFTVAAPASATAGTAFNFTVTAFDAFNDAAVFYSGTVHFTSSDGAAVLPANATLTNGVGTFSATLKSAGNQAITASDTVTGSITGTSGTIVVSAAAATHFGVGTPPTATAGSAFASTVTALDQFNNTATAYAGTVHFTSSDGAATLVANSTLTNGVGTFVATLRTAGNQSITATDTVTGSITGTSPTVAVSAAAATHFAVSVPGSATAGSPFTVTITAQDPFNNTATSYRGTVHFTSTDGAATVPGDYPFVAGDNGVHTFSSGVTLRTAGLQTVTGTDTVTSSVTGTSPVTVSAVAATHFSVSAPVTATAGAAFSLTVTARDQFNNVAVSYAGTVHFTSSDGAATLPANYPFVAGDGGVHTFGTGVTLATAGSQSVTATDTATSSITGTFGPITVNAAPATHFSLSAPALATAGSGFSVTVTALDPFNNTANAYRGTVNFTSSDAQAALPGNYAFSAGDNGVHNFSVGVTLKTAGGKTVTATDIVNGSITGTSGPVIVAAAAATHLAIIAPPVAVAGTPFSATVVALDPFNNTAGSYRGTVHFSTSDTGAGAALPGDYSFVAGDGGIHTFAGGVTLVTAGSQTVTATDTNINSITGTGGPVAVSPAVPTHLLVNAPSNATAGVGFTFIVSALDQFQNLVATFAGNANFTGTDAAASVPSGPLTNGAGTFAATLRTAGNQTITASVQTADGTITGTSAAVAVAAGAATHFAVSSPATATAGAALTVTVRALDAFNNTAAGYLGTVQFASNDAKRPLPANYPFVVGDNGIHQFTNGVAFKTAGSDVLSVADGGIGGVATVAVSPGAASHYSVSLPATSTAGVAQSVTVTALDPFNNVTTGYGGAVHFTTTDSGAGGALPGDYAFVAGDHGVHSFMNGVTFVTAGNQTVTATDTLTNSITATSGTVAVAAAGATHFQVSTPTTATAGTAFSATVTALDPFGNTAVAYRGTAHFSSSDTGAGVVLPANYTFVAGDNGLHTFANAVTLVTAGNRTVTATDVATSSIGGVGSTAVSPGSVTKLTFASTAYAGVSTVGMSPAVVVRLFDAFNNLATNSATPVSVTVGVNPGGALSLAATGVNAVTPVNGVATFTKLIPVGAGAGFTLVAHQGAVTANSPTFRSVVLSHIMPVGVAPEIFGPHPNNGANEAFIKGLYREILGRDAAQTEATFYVNQIDNATLTRTQAIDNFWNSPENRTREVVNYYNIFLGRNPAQNEIDFYVTRLQAGTDETVIVGNFFLSPEAMALPNNVYVTRLYEGLLSREPSSQEVSFYVGQLTTNTTTRTALFNNFLHAPEPAKVAVESDYLAYLQRPVTAAEENSYAPLIQAGTQTYAGVAKAVLNLPEFFTDATNATP